MPFYAPVSLPHLTSPEKHLPATDPGPASEHPMSLCDPAKTSWKSQPKQTETLPVNLQALPNQHIPPQVQKLIPTITVK